MLQVSDHQSYELLKAIASKDASYDPEVKLLKVPFSSPGYHTTLTGGMVHPTRDSAEYAVALLDTGEEWRRERAIEILDLLVSLQDQNPEHDTYGIWSWFWDEPLEQMAPPDWNWADFMGTQLLQVALDHRERIPAELMKRIDEAIVHASHSIIRRNVTMSYTNIAIMGTYVTYTAAELYGLNDLLEYADDRLHRFYKFTKEMGGYPEFNSPTYSIVAITELTRMLKDIRNPEARTLVNELYDMAWRDVATHFHATTRQWAGPHSRSYSTMLQPHTLAYLQRALGDSVRVFPDDQKMPVSIADHRIPARCPEKYHAYFAGIAETRNHVQTFIPGELSITGYTHLTPEYTIASINHSMMWNQCRPLVAYWNGAQGASALQVRFLHDLYDYSSACITSAQVDGNILSAFSFATDGGDTHCGLDRLKDATIRAKDLRLRLEFFNMPEHLPLPECRVGETTVLDLGVAQLGFNIAHVAFGDFTPWTEVSRDGSSLFVDVIIYQGETRTVTFTEIAPTVLVMGVSMCQPGALMPDLSTIRYTEQENTLRTEWPVDADTTLAVTVDSIPRTVDEIRATASKQ